MADYGMVAPILDALWLAKKALELMPELPRNMKPSHIRVLNVICKIYQQNGSVCVSDISTALKITKPSVTKLINELVVLQTITKTTDGADRRIVLLEPTAVGLECVRRYVVNYHARLAEYFSQLDPEKYRTTIETVEFIHHSMKEVSKENVQFENGST